MDTVHKTDMDALSDVNTRRGGTEPPDIGTTASIIPKGESLPKGVSVRYALAPGKQWFVLRATYGRESKAYDFITKDETEAYLPMHYVLKNINGKESRILEPLLPNLLFVYSTPEKVETYVKRTSELSFLSYYYDHFSTGEDRKNPPLTVGYDEMMNFIRVTSVENEHVTVVDARQCRYKSGDMVEITAGDFQGIQGRVARVAGQQRVVVELGGLCLVATAYIPSAFLKRI